MDTNGAQTSQSESPLSLGRRCLRGHLSRIFCKLSIHLKGPCLVLHIPYIPSNSLPPRQHVLFCPLRIPWLSLGTNLLVEAFWLHLPLKSYRLKLDIFFPHLFFDSLGSMRLPSFCLDEQFSLVHFPIIGDIGIEFCLLSFFFKFMQIISKTRLMIL